MNDFMLLLPEVEGGWSTSTWFHCAVCRKVWRGRRGCSCPRWLQVLIQGRVLIRACSYEHACIWASAWQCGEAPWDLLMASLVFRLPSSGLLLVTSHGPVTRLLAAILVACWGSKGLQSFLRTSGSGSSLVSSSDTSPCLMASSLRMSYWAALAFSRLSRELWQVMWANDPGSESGFPTILLDGGVQPGLKLAQQKVILSQRRAVGWARMALSAR